MSNREQLIEAAEAAYRQEREREIQFAAFLSAHLGLPNQAATELAREIKQTRPRERSQEHLDLAVHFSLGLPAGFSFTREQIGAVMRQKFPDIAQSRHKRP